MIPFDAYPCSPAVTRAYPIIRRRGAVADEDDALVDDTGSASSSDDETPTTAPAQQQRRTVVVRAGDVVAVAFSTSEPVRQPAVTINGRAAAVAQTSSDSRRFRASVAVTREDEPGSPVTFRVLPLVDFAGNAEEGDGTTTFTSSSGEVRVVVDDDESG